jgi:hypothetical protein
MMIGSLVLYGSLPCLDIEPRSCSTRPVTLLTAPEFGSAFVKFVAVSYRSRGPGFDFRSYQIFCIAMGLERGPLSLERINEELLER